MNQKIVLIIIISIVLLFAAGCLDKGPEAGSSPPSGATPAMTAPAIAWEKTFDLNGSDSAQGICQTPDGGFAAVGNTFTHSGKYVTTSSALFVIRTNAQGKELWTRTLNGTGFAQAFSIHTTADDGFIIAGHTNAALSPDPSLLLIKMDADGTTVWEKTYGDDGTYVGKSAVQTRDGGFIACGWTTAGPDMNFNLFLLRTDSSGNAIWQRQIGGAGSEEGNAVIESADGGFLIAGRSDSSGAGDNDMYLVRTDSGGSVLWEQVYGDISFDVAEDVQEIPGEGFVITGQISTPIDREHPEMSLHRSSVSLVRTDTSGNSLWEHALGDPKRDSLGHSVALTPDGGFVVAGQQKSEQDDWDMYVLRTDAKGLPVWDRSWGGEGFDLANAVAQTDDGGYIIAGGRSRGTDTDTALDVVMARFVSDGGMPDDPLTGTVPETSTPGMTTGPVMDPPPVLWEQTYTIGFQDQASDIVRTQDGGFVIAGTTVAENMSTVHGPPFPYDAFLIKTDGWGQVIWNRTFGGESGDGANAVRETADGGFIVAGYTSGPPHHDSDMYLVRTDATGKILWEQRYGGSGFDVLYGVCETGDGGFLIAGESDLNQTYDSTAVYLARTDRAGAIVWEKQYPGDLSGGARSLEPSSDGGSIIGAFMDPAILRTDDAGEQVWTIEYQGVFVSSARQTRDGGFIATGTGASRETGHSALALLRVDENGKTEWETFSPQKMSSGQSVQETTDGGFVAVGTSTEFDDDGREDLPSFSTSLYLMKTGPKGDILWEKTLEPAAFNEGIRVLQTSDNGYLVLGTIAGDGGSGAISYPGYMQGRIYLVKLEAE